ncbi:uncharacterized [Tachysurus ichikawai]
MVSSIGREQSAACRDVCSQRWWSENVLEAFLTIDLHPPTRKVLNFRLRISYIHRQRKMHRTPAWAHPELPGLLFVVAVADIQSLAAVPELDYSGHALTWG